MADFRAAPDTWIASALAENELGDEVDCNSEYAVYWCMMGRACVHLGVSHFYDLAAVMDSGDTDFIVAVTRLNDNSLTVDEAIAAVGAFL